MARSGLTLSSLVMTVMELFLKHHVLLNRPRVEAGLLWCDFMPVMSQLTGPSFTEEPRPAIESGMYPKANPLTRGGTLARGLSW